MADMLKAVNACKKALVVFAEKNEKAVASCRNIPGVVTAYTNTLNVYDILNCDTVVIEKAATEKITEVYA
jgi:large subunit ribosomal protein L4